MAQSQDAITFQGPQEMMDHTPGSAVPVGRILLFPTAGSVNRKLCGVATRALEANKLGALAIAGIFKVKKDSGITFTVGSGVAWDNTDKTARPEGAANTVDIGVCVGAAASGDEFVLTKINIQGSEGVLDSGSA